MKTANLVLDSRNEHGEGVSWSMRDERLYWTDIEGRKLWCFDPISGSADQWSTPERVCCFARRASGGFIVGTETGFGTSQIGSDSIDMICEIESDLPGTRLNDGRCDRQGRFIAGGMDEKDLTTITSAYRMDADLSVHKIIPDLACANSTCFSPDGTIMYFCDTPQQVIWAYDYDVDSGTPRNRRVLYDFKDEPGIPDGSTVDADGCVWNAEWNGARVIRITPDGRLDRIIEMPVLNPTCCAFGGGDLDVLYITTSRLGLTETQILEKPLSGGLFAFSPGNSGIPEPEFSG
ncbi:MAG: SMP-30/gluconolactonase/LRE family protein [Rhodospirillales bacterium]|nr:SMP-30/gluconolactonase/LRE family protein [Rhodospirillales bacterium]